GLPIWHYEIEGIRLEKHVLFLYGQNTVHITYRLLSSHDAIRLELRPSIHFRGHDQAVNELPPDNYRLSAESGQNEVTMAGLVTPLRLVLRGDCPAFTYDGGSRREIHYQKEAERGYPARGSLWSPGYFSLELRAHHAATLIASTEWWHTMLALT